MRSSAITVSLLAPALLVACRSHASESEHHAAMHHDTQAKPAQHGAQTSATIEPRSGSTLTGKATFTETTGGVLVEIVVHHAPPGWHAVHIHEKGDCSAPDASSAGAHFNPSNKSHGSPQAPEHHAGDFGNMWVDEKGEGRHTLTMSGLTVSPGPSSVHGRAIVVHEKVDDFVTQPSGNAGARIGCGVIQ